jgi:tetratricopeptide (TPR) repeat protein
VESLLQKAVHLDPRLGVAYLQLGVLYSERSQLPDAISAYEKAINADPRLEAAHYRLAQAYRQTGERSKAQEEIQLYQQVSKEAAQRAERERHDLQQFVYTLRDHTPAVKPH